MRIYQPNEISAIVAALNNGLAAIVPTDTQLGLIALNPDVIYLLKQRPREKLLIRFVHSLEQVSNPNPLFCDLANTFWPGALTLIANNNAWRMPNHSSLLSILKQTGPLYSSSANISGQAPFNNTSEVLTNQSWQKHANQFIIVEGQAQTQVPSTIYDTDQKQLLRPGVLASALQQYLKQHEAWCHE